MYLDKAVLAFTYFSLLFCCYNHYCFLFFLFFFNFDIKEKKPQCGIKVCSIVCRQMFSTSSLFLIVDSKSSSTQQGISKSSSTSGDMQSLVEINMVYSRTHLWRIYAVTREFSRNRQETTIADSIITT